mmetsp:Transcript_6568/g.10561  ORF Transcript_6568/g.10561 Transcript_6568/m.10561 type:complete len:83 (-) Transcript_6568:51-299(-)
MAGYSKTSISIIKNLPQIYLNWKRKSTEGWSVWNVFCDLTGSLFNFGQMMISLLVLHPEEGFNVIKFLMSSLAITFDLIFLI